MFGLQLDLENFARTQTYQAQKINQFFLAVEKLESL